eukprot:6758612-Pyramimonas_sp.AAC.1
MCSASSFSTAPVAWPVASRARQPKARSASLLAGNGSSCAGGLRMPLPGRRDRIDPAEESVKLRST